MRFQSELSNKTDYYAGGSSMPGRSFNSNQTRYGFNGKEKNPELYEGSYDFGARLYDARLGRWLSVDPLSRKYPSHSPYNYALNNPIYFIDPDGGQVVPADDKSAALYAQFKANANPTWQAYLQTLEASDVIYNIDYSANDKAVGGETRWTSMNAMDGDQQSLTIYIIAPEDDQNDAYAINILGDELTHAYQFEKGDIGYSSKDVNGVPTSVVTGYDFIDEIESKEGSIQAANDNGVEIKGSTKDYNKKVNEKKTMTGPEWINEFKSKKTGDSYKAIFEGLGGAGLNGKLAGYLTGGGTHVKSARANGEISNYVYRRGGRNISPNTNDAGSQRGGTNNN